MQSFLIAAVSVSTLVLGAPIAEPQYVAVVENKPVNEQNSVPRKVLGYYVSHRRQLYVIPELPEEEEVNEKTGSDNEEETLSLLKAETARRLRKVRRSLLYDLASVGESIVAPPRFHNGLSGATFSV